MWIAVTDRGSPKAASRSQLICSRETSRELEKYKYCFSCRSFPRNSDFCCWLSVPLCCKLTWYNFIWCRNLRSFLGALQHKVCRIQSLFIAHPLLLTSLSSMRKIVSRQLPGSSQYSTKTYFTWQKLRISSQNIWPPFWTFKAEEGWGDNDISTEGVGDRRKGWSPLTLTTLMARAS